MSARDVRHLAATLTHAGAGDIFAVKKVLRHSTIQLTGDAYTELPADVDREIAEKAAASCPELAEPPDVTPLDGGADRGRREGREPDGGWNVT